ncbi:hypothetical protein [Luteibacter yeojuensis]|uniref:Uncharacterized protein n=1 Tax=Luteibacter yeojuensis TaxID=345309 RepID=A0A0F3KU69_9GAMM|nr:hypothetical protein [Luteibacter yeojuensis]KJV34763.1 hypothetical protein VI08_09240 [Luteibacter yeojuensis]
MNHIEDERQSYRRSNLRHLTRQLAEEGMESLAAQGAALGYLAEQELRNLLAGAPISDAMAREIEWAVQRPEGWLDGPRKDALDD